MWKMYNCILLFIATRATARLRAIESRLIIFYGLLYRISDNDKLDYSSCLTPVKKDNSNKAKIYPSNLLRPRMKIYKIYFIRYKK